MKKQIRFLSALAMLAGLYLMACPGPQASKDDASAVKADAPIQTPVPATETPATTATPAADRATGTPATTQAPPALQIAEWVKGQPIDLAKGQGKVRVIEFWATWCPPCRKSIPHLTELQKKYKDQGLEIVGISNEPAATVKDFVQKMGDKMEYAVAVDKDSATERAYLEANGISTIPHAFIIDRKGVVVWNGNPLAGIEEAIEKALKE